VVDGDRFEDTSGNCWTHVEQKHLHAVKDTYGVAAGKMNVQVQDAYATKAGKLMFEAGTVVIKQAAGTSGTAPSSGPQSDASGLKDTAAGLIGNATDLTGAAGAQKGDSTAAVDGSEVTAPNLAVDTGTPSVSGSGLVIESVQFEAKSSAAMKFKSGATLDLEASAPLSIKGALVKIEGSGPVQIKGAIVQLG
jgi:hypothetical protein